MTKFFPLPLAIVLVLAVASPSWTLAAEAQTAGSAPDSAPDLAPETREETLAAIERVRQEATESGPLAPETKAEILELCDKAVAKFTEASTLAATTVKLQQELEKSAATLEALQSKTIHVDPEPLPPGEISAEAMRARLSAADQRVSAAREELQKEVTEIKRRAERRKVLPELLVNCREQLSSVLESLKQPAVGQHALLAEARKLCLICRREFREKELHLLEQENRTYEATTRLWLARRDAAEKKLQASVACHKVALTQAEEFQRQEAERQTLEAQRSAINAHPAIKEAAAKNAELAERNQELVSRMQTVQQRLAEASELGQEMKKRLGEVTDKADAAGYSPAIGVMLRVQQDQLPVLTPFHQRVQGRPAELSQLFLDIYEWESQRREVLQVEKAVESARREIEANGVGAMDDQVEAELRRVLEARAKILAELYSNAYDCSSKLGELDAEETEVIKTTQELASFIAEHVLWVRSDPALSLGVFRRAATSWQGWQSLLDSSRAFPEILGEDTQQYPLAWGVAGLLLATLVLGRSRFRSNLKRSGEAAAKATNILFRPTVEASVATILLAAPVPMALGFLGWRLCQTNVGLPYASGWAIVLFATVYAMLDLVLHASRSSGLGTNHFGWDPKGLAAIRHAARSLQLLALPLLALAGGIEMANSESLLNTIGRFSLIAALVVIGFVSYRLFRSTGPLATSLGTNAKGWGNMRAVMKVLAPLSVVAVAGLIVASAAGYHYTAIQLTRRVFFSCVFVFACLALRSLLIRWLLVAYRRVVMQQAREKRQALLEAQGQSTTESPAVEKQPQVNLSNVNQQARRLVAVGAVSAFVVSTWFIWGDILPALGIFDRVQLWQSGLVPVDPDVDVVYVTLAGLLLSAALFALTWFAGCNLPGLLEIAVLRKLPLDAGARYAANSMARYTIFVVGIALSMRQLGIGWHSVQWLVAAMTVGLGFGLQEIFANFVSGIILLFERPARVGDTVTIGEITGTVTKIRIRATTILDWDSKELIVPNKEFVTGNLVNWTLSTPNLRLIIKVGVAYGSDTRLATQLLYQVAEENPNVLDAPSPSVVFNEFGDSSLNFELRLFVSDLALYRSLRHELHLAIDDLFRQHQISIAFPQCDLHIKSLPAVARVALSTPDEEESDDQASDVAA